MWGNEDLDLLGGCVLPAATMRAPMLECVQLRVMTRYHRLPKRGQPHQTNMSGIGAGKAQHGGTRHEGAVQSTRNKQMYRMYPKFTPAIWISLRP